jgi:DNA-directed RNA polymerase subunit RPC12/RpoP
VSERSLRCGNCGADVTFSSPGTVVVVCPHCNWASYRKDVDLETLGQVAQPAPIASQFQIGTAGRYRGSSFTVRGQLQLDHGAGLWNEWAAEDENGDWLWIAEAQGELLVFRETEAPAALDVSKLHPGEWIKLQGKSWVINEVGEGLVVAAAGEHPIKIAVGERTSYVDLQSGALAVATLDTTRGETPELLIGSRAEPEQLELDPLTQPEHRPETVKSKRIDCANCGGAIELVDPEHAQRVGCPSCGTLLELDSDKSRALEAANKIAAAPAIPLGAQGELAGELVQVLGFMERRVKAEGRWWPWREYLLRTPRGAYRWLVEDSGHWLYAKPVPYATVAGGSYEGTPFKHYTSGEAQVHWVVGEFYWQVQAGETVQSKDFSAPPRALSIESTPLEVQASLSRSIEPEELEAAFEAPLKLPPRSGVGMAQESPHRPRAEWKLYGLLAVLLIALRIFFGVTQRNEVVFAGQLGPTPADKNADPAAQFSDEFTLRADPGNLVLQLQVPGLEQGWIGLDGALVNMDSGQVTTFRASAQRYSGVSGGERWSEGNRRGTAVIGSVPAGTYRLRLAAGGWDAGVGKRYQVTARSQVPRNLWWLLCLLLPLVFPLLTSLRWWSFEANRWANSDHPWGES